MKRTILGVLMVVMIATPCFAQEIEPDGIFSIAWTTWMRIGVAIGILYPPLIELYHDTVYFTDRSIETSSGDIGISSNVSVYLDYLVFSVASDSKLIYMILQPTIGVGVYLALAWHPQPLFQSQAMNIPHQIIILPDVGLNFGFMFKIDDDDWTPPSE